MTAPRSRPVLVAGVPRSGSTWIGMVLARAEGCTYVHEPDNETMSPQALGAKRGRGRYPFLRPGDRAPAYERCWAAAFAGGRPAGGLAQRLAGRALAGAGRDEIDAAIDPSGSRLSPRLTLAVAAGRPLEPHPEAGTAVVKSVHAALALDWIMDRWAPRLVLVRRHPLAVVASFKGMGWTEAAVSRSAETAPQELSREAVAHHGHPELDAAGATDPIAQAAWLVGFLTSAMEGVLERHPDAVVADHEQACADPRTVLRAAAEAAGLVWTPACDAFLAESDRPGTGYETNRVAAREPDKWRTALSPDEIARATAVLERFSPRASLA